jgi:undecaprenyl-diphosphatase
METFWTSASDLDQQVFLTLNGIHTPVTDFLFAWITNKYTWIPLYLLLIFVVCKEYGKRGGWMILLSLLALILADHLTSGVMKPYFERFRPCHDPTIGAMVHNVVGCGGTYGFASSHASTSFALTTGLYLFTRARLPQMKWLFVWAMVYSYSRVAVGVHYPGDILVGALIGAITALIIVQFYLYFNKSLV